MEKRRVSGALIVLSAICLTFALLLGSALICVYDRSFYQKTYDEIGVAQDIGMSSEDLMIATETLLDYCKNKRNDLNVTVTVNGMAREAFNKREMDHMADVKKLAMGASAARNALFVLFAALAAAGILLPKRRFGDGFKPFLIGLVSGIVLIAAVGLYAAFDFGTFWTRFHLLFFTNDLWLLDPNTSLLINMVPEAFFFRLVMRILLFFAFFMVLCLTVGITGTAMKRRKNMGRNGAC